MWLESTVQAQMTSHAVATIGLAQFHSLSQVPQRNSYKGMNLSKQRWVSASRLGSVGSYGVHADFYHRPPGAAVSPREASAQRSRRPRVPPRSTWRHRRRRSALRCQRSYRARLPHCMRFVLTGRSMWSPDWWQCFRIFSKVATPAWLAYSRLWESALGAANRVQHRGPWGAC